MKLGVIQNLFTWLCKNNQLTANPAADLDQERAVLTIRGKGSKGRTVPVGQRALEWL